MIYIILFKKEIICYMYNGVYSTSDTVIVIFFRTEKRQFISRYKELFNVSFVISFFIAKKYVVCDILTNDPLIESRLYGEMRNGI